MTMIVYIELKSCRDCRHHIGKAISQKQGEVTTCNHPHTVEREADIRKRMTPYNKIPDFCPLRYGAKY